MIHNHEVESSSLSLATRHFDFRGAFFVCIYSNLGLIIIPTGIYDRATIWVPNLVCVYIQKNLTTFVARLSGVEDGARTHDLRNHNPLL